MSGILSIEKRKTYRLLSEEFPGKYVDRYCQLYKCVLSADLHAKIEQVSNSGFVPDDKISKNPRKMIPIARFYFQKDGIVYSMYESFYRCSFEGKYSVLLMKEEEIAVAFIKNGEMVQKIRHHRNQHGAMKKSSRSGQHQFVAEVSALLQSWKDELYGSCVFVSCPKEYEPLLLEETSKTVKGYLRTVDFNKLPFAIDAASMQELDRVWEKLFCVVEHGPMKAFLRAVEAGPDSNSVDYIDGDATEINVIASTKQQRRDEKQRWPGINPQKKIVIHEALLSNHYETLQDLVENDPEVIDYLSSIHEKLGGQTFMHLVVKENLLESVQFLLDVGCDPSVPDDTGKVPYECAKTLEMKQIFVDFRNEQPERIRWTKCRIPEELEVPRPALSKNTRKNVQVKPKSTSGKSKQKQTKYVNMIDDEFDYDDDELYSEDEEFCPAVKPKHQNLGLPKENEEIDLEEKKLKTHSLLETKWSQKNSSPFDHPRTANAFDVVRKTKSNSEDLRKFVEKRMQPEVKMYFVESEVLYSGYSTMLGGSYYLHNTSLTPHVVLLMNDEHFAGAAIDNGLVCRRKTLYRSGAHLTKIGDLSSKSNLLKNRFIEDKLAECIEYVFKYWPADLDVKVLFSCPTEFEMALKLHILETNKSVILTEPGSAKIFEAALETEDFSVLEEMLEDPTEVVLAVNNERMWQYATSDQLKKLYRAIIKNDYDNLSKTVDSLGWYFNRWGVVHSSGQNSAKFGWQTFLHFAVRNNMDQTVKFLLEKCYMKDVVDRDGKLAIEYCQTDEMRALFNNCQ